MLALNNYKKFKDVNLFLFSLFDAIYIFLISYFNSGETGMSTIAEVIIPIFLAYTLLVVYRQKIFSAYVKIVYIFAGISLLFFLLAQFHPEILLSILKRSVGIKGESSTEDYFTQFDIFGIMIFEIVVCSLNGIILCGIIDCNISSAVSKQFFMLF